MKCIFCKKDSSASKSIEHIVPESLCNDDHVLQQGVVCDSCNNCFARKVEKPVLNSDEFKYLRFHQGIKTKKNKIPKVNALYNMKPFELSYDASDKSCLIIEDLDILKDIHNNTKGRLIIPNSGASPTKQQMGRFIAKMAIEYFAQRMLTIDNWNEDFINNRGLDDIIKFTRYPNKDEKFDFTKRKVYEENSTYNDNGLHYQTVVEMGLCIINQIEIDANNIQGEIYFIVIIFGIEYAINLADNNMDGHKKYLKDNDYVSPLYLDDYANKYDKNRVLIRTKIKENI